MKITTKIGLLLVILAVVLGAGVYGAFEFQKNQAIENERAQVDGTARIIATNLDTDIRNTRARLSSAALQTDSTADVDLRQLLTGPNAIGVAVVDENGTVVRERGQTSLVTNASVGADVSDQPYFTDALESRTAVSKPVWLPDAGRYATLTATPILSNGEVDGVVIVSQYLGVREATTDDELSVYVADTGRTATLTNGSVAGIPNTIGEREAVESTGWEVTVTKETTGLRAQLQRLAVLQVGGLFGVLLLVGGVAGLQYWTILRQVGQLEDGFDALREGNYDHSLSLTGSDEWNRITEGYEHVTAELTEREAEIRQREERLGVLNRALRHNLRNAMTCVIWRFEQLEARGEDEEIGTIASKGKAKAEEVSELGDKARLIESVLTSAEQGQTDHDLVSVTQNAIDVHTRRYPDTRVETELPATAPIRAIGLLQPALIEVLENATEHSDSEHPTVRVTVETDPASEQTTLAVTDDGPGIPRHEYRVIEDGQEERLEHGSGLGLWLVHWTVEKSGAEIAFETDGVPGTTVNLTFAQAAEDSDETA